jgi:hypothetical protein
VPNTEIFQSKDVASGHQRLGAKNIVRSRKEESCRKFKYMYGNQGNRKKIIPEYWSPS